MALLHLTHATHIVTGHSEKCLSTNGTITGQTQFSSTVTLRPRGQNTVLLVKHPTNSAMGRITLAAAAEQLVCSPRRSRGFSFSYTTHIKNALRCPGQGTCQGTRCEDLRLTDAVEEMKDYNRWPGFTSCQASTCSGLRCLPEAACGHPMYPACIITRVVAEPTNATTVEWFDCPRWAPLLTLALRVETGGAVHETSMKVEPAHTQAIDLKWGQWAVTVFPGGRTPSVLYDSLFATDGARMAVADELPRDLFCATETAAKHHNCSLQPTACSGCHATSHASLACNCKSINWGDVFIDSTRVLPLHSAVGLFRHAEWTLWLDVPTTPYQITISGNWELALVEQNTQCVIDPIAIKGFYSSATCATFTHKSRTSTGIAMAHVDCNSTSFETTCSDIDKEVNATFCYDNARVNVECTVMCPGGATSFQLIGELHYLAHNGATDYEHVGGTRLADEEDLMSKLERWGRAIREFLRYLPYLVDALAILALLAGLSLLATKLKIYWRFMRIFVGSLIITVLLAPTIAATSTGCRLQLFNPSFRAKFNSAIASA